ncbi:MAG: flavodoxin family protein [Phycisphaerae bacterium]|nr:flavodoxin family protein [Phycisphaerae bacterium]
MKVVAFNGSPRKEGNTDILVRQVFTELHKEGIETELVELAGLKIRGCTACYGCFTNRDKRCVIDDDLNGCIEKMIDADGIILASPTYFANVSSEMKALIDRAGLVSRANDDLFRRKIGAAVVAVRRGGACSVFNAINAFFLMSQMIVPGSIYWNMGFGLERGEVREDEEGLRTMKVLAGNMAWLLKKTRG